MLNPYGTPRYAPPIGFVQSPLLATLCLVQSPVLTTLADAADAGVNVSIYLDDFVGSGPEEDTVRAVYEQTLSALAASNLRPNTEKLVAPATRLEAFNCNLTHYLTEVTSERIDQFFSRPRGAEAVAAFEAYVHRVSRHNR